MREQERGDVMCLGYFSPSEPRRLRRAHRRRCGSFRLDCQTEDFSHPLLAKGSTTTPSPKKAQRAPRVLYRPQRAASPIPRNRVASTSVKPSYGAVRGSAHHITFLRRIARSAACATAYFRRGFRSTRCRPRGSASFFYHGVTLKPRVVTGYHRQDLSCLSTSHVQVTIIRRQ